MVSALPTTVLPKTIPSVTPMALLLIKNGTFNSALRNCSTVRVEKTCHALGQFIYLDYVARGTRGIYGDKRDQVGGPAIKARIKA